MSKKRIERELAKSLLEKRLLNMSQDKVDDYFDEVKRKVDSQHPFRNNPIIPNLYNKDGLYLEKNYGNAEWAEMSRRVTSIKNSFNNDKKDKRLKELNSEIKNLQNEIKIERETRQMGGLLEDERIGYADGNMVKDTETEDQKQMRFLMDVYQRAVDSGQEEDAQDIVRQINQLDKKMIEEKAEIADRMRKADGGSFPDLNKDGEVTYADVLKGRGVFQEGGRIGYKDGTDELYSKILKEKVSQSDYQRKISMGSMLAESEKQRDKIEDMKNEYESLFGIEYSQVRKERQDGGEIDNQMSMLMNNEQEMLPDEEMEDNYMDFILDEALTEEEEDMLMSKLEQDEQLSMLFDKVVEVASEFAGSGPVDGPGSGVSDSIPARLSDGEFVFTAKAVEEIGADNLMAMMKDAEMKADERQGMANGGEMDEETVVVKGDDEPARQEIRVVKETVDAAGRMVEDEDEISKGIKSQMMLDPNQRHVRS